jgi:hypothetical protein
MGCPHVCGEGASDARGARRSESVEWSSDSVDLFMVAGMAILEVMSAIFAVKGSTDDPVRFFSGPSPRVQASDMSCTVWAMFLKINDRAMWTGREGFCGLCTASRRRCGLGRQRWVANLGEAVITIVFQGVFGIVLQERRSSERNVV